MNIGDKVYIISYGTYRVMHLPAKIINMTKNSIFIQPDRAHYVDEYKMRVDGRWYKVGTSTKQGAGVHLDFDFETIDRNIEISYRAEQARAELGNARRDVKDFVDNLNIEQIKQVAALIASFSAVQS